MPNSSSEQAYPHLPLLREERSAERRKKPGWGGNRPARGGRSVFSPQLESAAPATDRTPSRRSGWRGRGARHTAVGVSTPDQRR